MAKKQFKTESKKLLDMMVNSIYTNKDIFLRELISNASDAIDKLYFKSLTDNTVDKSRGDFEIRISTDKENRTIRICDNGCGMTKDELEENLGVIAKSGSFDFKNNPDNKDKEEIDIIGQFGVGFYSAFMVAKNIVVESLAHGETQGYSWESSGADGYTIRECDRDKVGTEITITLKDDTENTKFGEYLEDWKIEELVKKYSDYIRYPIRMFVSSEKLKEGSSDEYETFTEDEVLNSMVPLWKKSQNEVTDEEIADFYKGKFFDFEAPLNTIRQKAEGGVNFEALMFIPAHAPVNFYSKDFEKGLQLYSSGVLIMEKCKDLLPDYFGFVRGLVDSSDLSLNISREILQQDRQLKIIAKAIEKKIVSELKKMLENDRENYNKFFSVFGSSIKWGIYSDFGAHKESLKDLVLFKSSKDNEYVSLKEYVAGMKEEQKEIYYASGDSAERIAVMPQVSSVVSRGYEVIYLTEDVDEFAISVLGKYDEHEFVNVCKENFSLATEEEKEKIEKENEDAKELLDFIRESADKNLFAVRFTNDLKDHAVCISSEGEISLAMEKTLSRMPGMEANPIRAQLVLEINIDHPMAEKMKKMFENEKDELAKISKVLYAHARLISGLSVDNPTELSNLVCDLMLK